MQDQLNAAFADLNARLIESDQKWAAAKLDGLKAFLAEAEAGFKAGEYPFLNMTSGYGRFDRSMAVNAHFGSKAMAALLCGHGREGALRNMRRNTEALIAKRDATIIKALNKKGITEIPEFRFKYTGNDGYEGEFKVAGHRVTIRTIIAGGYNIQRLHQRTLVKVN